MVDRFLDREFSLAVGRGVERESLEGVEGEAKSLEESGLRSAWALRDRLGGLVSRRFRAGSPREPDKPGDVMSFQNPQ